MPKSIRQEDVNALAQLIAEIASNVAIGSDAYFRKLILQTNLPENWKRERKAQWTGDSELDAIELINWAVSRGVNPSDARYETLGSILTSLLKDLGLSERRWVAAMITVYGLYLDQKVLDDLLKTYNVPRPAGPTLAAAPEVGPAFDWKGPTEELELQAWFKPDPEFIDVGYLRRVIERAASVCRVEIVKKQRPGTGVLIAPNLLLTNYHVLKMTEAEDMEENARDCTVTFGLITGNQPDDSTHLTFKLAAATPILKSSPVHKLDYVLLQVEDRIAQVEGIEHSALTEELPSSGMALSILQHPAGGTMKLAMSANGVTGVYQDRGLVQYVTRAAGGSSGSPCFNDDWKVVALHHAERSKAFGAIREGILASAIRAEIKEYL